MKKYWILLPMVILVASVALLYFKGPAPDSGRAAPSDPLSSERTVNSESADAVGLEPAYPPEPDTGRATPPERADSGLPAASKDSPIMNAPLDAIHRMMTGSSEGSVAEIARLARSVLEEFHVYRAEVSRMAKDPTEPAQLRSLMLEMLESDWRNTVSREAIRAVFDDIANESAVTGLSAQILAKQGVEIGDEVIARYAAAPEKARFFYSKALGLLGSDAAGGMLVEEAEKAESVANRVAAAQALGRIDAEQHAPSLYGFVANTSQTKRDMPASIESEVLAIHSVSAIAAGGVDSQPILLDIAADPNLPIDVRIAAVEEMKGLTSNDRNAIDELKRIAEQTAKSELPRASKARFQQMIDMVVAKELEKQ